MPEDTVHVLTDAAGNMYALTARQLETSRVVDEADKEALKKALASEDVAGFVRGLESVRAETIRLTEVGFYPRSIAPFMRHSIPALRRPSGAW